MKERIRVLIIEKCSRGVFQISKEIEIRRIRPRVGHSRRSVRSKQLNRQGVILGVLAAEPKATTWQFEHGGVLVTDRTKKPPKLLWRYVQGSEGQVDASE